MAEPDGVYALRYAHRTVSVKGEHFYGHPDDCRAGWPIDYYVWAICRGDDVVLLDTGFTRAEGIRRGHRDHLASPAELVELLGRDRNQVSTIVLSHLHYDHTGTLADFPGATVVLQEREFGFWQTPMAARGGYVHLANPGDLAELQRRRSNGTLSLVDGDWELDDRISGHLTGGHTPGTQILRVAATPPVVLAADASHFYANYEDDAPYGVVHELAGMYTAFDRIRELAGDGIVVPGHDPAVRRRHPAVDGRDGLIHLITEL